MVEERTDWVAGHWMFAIAQGRDTYIERRSVGKAERVMFSAPGNIAAGTNAGAADPGLRARPAAANPRQPRA